MARLILAAERVTRARALLQQARALPVPPQGGKYDFSYVAQVKDLLRQARDLIKFIPMSPSATPALKDEVKAIYQEAEQTDRELLH